MKRAVTILSAVICSVVCIVAFTFLAGFLVIDSKEGGEKRTFFEAYPNHIVWASWISSLIFFGYGIMASVLKKTGRWWVPIAISGALIAAWIPSMGLIRRSSLAEPPSEQVEPEMVGMATGMVWFPLLILLCVTSLVAWIVRKQNRIAKP